MLSAIGEIRRMDQAERHRGEHFFLFSPLRDIVDQRRGIPLARVNYVPFRVQPFVQQ